MWKMVMKWIIFFCCYTGSITQEGLGKIEITLDTVKAFNSIWIVDSYSNNINSNGDIIYKGEFYIRENNSDTKAILTIEGKNVSINIIGIESASMEQLKHDTYLYDDEYVKLLNQYQSTKVKSTKVQNNNMTK